MTRRENDKQIQGIPTALCENQQGNVQFTRCSNRATNPKHHVSEDCKAIEIPVGISHEESIYASDGSTVLISRDQVTTETLRENLKAFNDGSSEVEDYVKYESACSCCHEQSRLFAGLCGGLCGRSCSTGSFVSTRTCSKCNRISDQENLKESSANRTVISHDEFEESQTESKKTCDILDVKSTRLKNEDCSCPCKTSTRNAQCNCKLVGCRETECKKYQTNQDSANTKIECKLKIEQGSKGPLERAGESCESMEEEIEVDVIGDDETLNNSQMLNCIEIKVSSVETSSHSKKLLNKRETNEDSCVTNQIFETSGKGGSRQTLSLELLSTREGNKLINSVNSKQLGETECNKQKNNERKTCFNARDVSDMATDVSFASTVDQGNATEGFDVSLPIDEHMESEGDGYNRFYFESDNLALKDNEHYHVLLQTLVALESQRIQSIKDLDMLTGKQRIALEDPIGFVEKLQNNEPLGLPARQAVVKLPHIPWEEYVTSLGSLERQAFPYQHQTRKISQQLEKNCLLSTTQQDSVETCTTTDPQRPSLGGISGNAYSVFGGDFVVNKHGKSLDRESYLTGSSRSLQGDSKSVKGRLYDISKPVTFNQPWTSEEQAKLERLLQIYPQEEVESKRWEKIAKALGNRTTKQVASRVQKYFIKLAKASLPIPGRMPNVPKLGIRCRRSSHYQTLSFRNSTFFPSYQPRVYMDDDQDEDTFSMAWSDDTTTAYPSDDESIPADLKDSEDYKELVQLKRIKRQKMQRDEYGGKQAVHQGYMCDGCGVEPIRGTRWHCTDCPHESSVDFCSDCVQREVRETKTHKITHKLEPVNRTPSFFVDGDYMGLSGTSNGYNYLDPNFLPAAS